MFHLGPERDLSIFAGLDVTFAPAETADYVVCSGLFDDTRETPDDYRELLATMRARSLFMVCANPDIVVERGDELVYCAGAIADAYAAIGGEVLYCGKPYAPIYQAALAKAAVLRGRQRRCRGCWRSGIRCAPTSRALLPLGSIACSSFPPCMRTKPAGGGAGSVRLGPTFAAAGVVPEAVTRRLAVVSGGSMRSACRLPAKLSAVRQHRFDLGLQRLRVERLDDVVVGPALRAAITFSVFDSAVTMMKGVAPNSGSARTWRSRS